MADYLFDLSDRIAYDSVDDNGVAQGLKVQRIKMGYGRDNHYSDYVSSIPGVNASSGLAGEIVVNKFGRNEDVDTSDEDIWDGGATWVAPTATRIHDLTSTSTDDDNVGGTGARTVQVYGLDADYDLQDETVELNGTSDVATASSYTMIYRLIVRTAGSGGANAGTITATAQTDSTVTAQITIGNNQTLMAIYQVPHNHTGYLLGYYATTNKANLGNADIKLWAKPIDEVWQLKQVQSLASAGSSRFHHIYSASPKFTEKTLLRLSAISAAVNNDISAGFDLVLIPTTT
jgi:hypothetical protein